MPIRPATITRRACVAVAVLAVLSTACSSTESIVVEADQPIAVKPAPAPPPVDEPVGAGAPDGGSGRTEVERHEGIENPTPVPWERVSFNREAQQLTVMWTSGVEPCTALDRVTVEFTETEVVVTVLEGAPPEAAVISCVMMAQAKQHTVDLDEDPRDRRFVDGAA